LAVKVDGTSTVTSLLIPPTRILCWDQIQSSDVYSRQVMKAETKKNDEEVTIVPNHKGPNFGVCRMS
jgi:hypothetical protein